MLYEDCLCFRFERDGNLARSERLVCAGDDDIYDCHERFFCERLEDANLVEAVEELWLELAVRNHVVREAFFNERHIHALVDIIANKIRTSITSCYDNCVAEADFTVSSIAEDAFVEQLKQGS